MKNQFLLFLAVAAMIFSSCGDTKTQQSATKNASVNIREDIDVEQFRMKMSEENTMLLDVRTPEEIAEGKIEGALEMDFYADDFEQKALALDKGKTYLIYCRSGGRSGETCDLLHQNGFSAVYNLSGGYLAWSKD